MGGAVDLDVLGLGKLFRELTTGRIDRQDVVCRAVQDEARHAELAHLRHVTAEVFEPRRYDGVRGDRCTRGGDVPAVGDVLLVLRAGAPAFLAPQLVLLAEGAQTTAAILGTADVAAQARAAASTLIDASLAVASD